MRKKQFFGLLLAVLMLCTSGCSLAREPREQERMKQDRLVGVFLVCSETDERMSDNPNWVEVGAEEIGAGEIVLPKRILPATFDEATHKFQFPGVKGYGLFAAQIGTGDSKYSMTHCDLEDGNFAAMTRDYGTDFGLSGTLYLSEEIDGTVWTAYHVFQKEDGTVYLDGSGDSYALGSEFTITIDENAEQSYNGETEQQCSTKVEVHFKRAEQARKTVLYQYSADGDKIADKEIEIRTEEVLQWEENAAWAVLEETLENEVRYSIYPRSAEEPETRIPVMLVDANGIGRYKEIILQ